MTGGAGGARGGGGGGGAGLPASATGDAEIPATMRATMARMFFNCMMNEMELGSGRKALLSS